jgi:hypothetical protein
MAFTRLRQAVPPTGLKPQHTDTPPGQPHTTEWAAWQCLPTTGSLCCWSECRVPAAPPLRASQVGTAPAPYPMINPLRHHPQHGLHGSNQRTVAAATFTPLPTPSPREATSRPKRAHPSLSRGSPARQGVRPLNPTAHDVQYVPAH